MTYTQPQHGDNLSSFPKPAGGQVEPAPEVLEGELLSERDIATAVGLLSGLLARVVMLVRGVATSPRVVHARAVVVYRLRKAPRDAVRLGWFFLRGHARWIGKGWDLGQSWAPAGRRSGGLAGWGFRGPPECAGADPL